MLEQRSPEWFAIRIGRITASRMGDVMAKTKTGWGASRKDYRRELVYERLTGEAWPRSPSEAMRWGTNHEAEAREVYARRIKFLNDSMVEEVGFCLHPALPFSGASPDGLVGTEGLLEVKCPNLATHLDTIERGSVTNEHQLQCQWQMACTGRQWVDFCSYDPRWALQPLFIKRVKRDADKIAELENEVMAFSAEVDDKVLFHKNGGKP